MCVCYGLYQIFKRIKSTVFKKTKNKIVKALQKLTSEMSVKRTTFLPLLIYTSPKSTTNLCTISLSPIPTQQLLWQGRLTHSSTYQSISVPPPYHPPVQLRFLRSQFGASLSWPDEDRDCGALRLYQ